MADGSHPFDPAFTLMQRMQTELTELRAALQAEQQQRASEVASLRGEVNDLRKQLTELTGEYHASCERLTCALTSETALRGRAVDKLSADLGKVIAQATEVQELKVTTAKDLATLTEKLQIERQERSSGQHKLEEGLAEEAQQRANQYAQVAQELGEVKQGSEMATSQDREFLTSVALSMQRAGQLLGGVSQAPPPPHWQDAGCSPNSTLSTGLGVGGSPSPSPASPSER